MLSAVKSWINVLKIQGLSLLDMASNNWYLLADGESYGFSIPADRDFKGLYYSNGQDYIYLIPMLSARCERFYTYLGQGSITFGSLRFDVSFLLSIA